MTWTRCVAWGQRLARHGVFAGALLVSACAGAAAPAVLPGPPSADPADAADAQLRQGCYGCLIRARDAYEAMPPGPARAARLFATNLLIGLRRGELGLDPGGAFERAEAVTAVLPPNADAAFVLELARLVPPDSRGTPQAVLDSHLEAARHFWASHTTPGDRLARAAVTPELRAYLLTSLSCLTTAAGLPGAGGSQAAAADAASVVASPLVRYRLATCPVVLPDRLDELASADAAFVEAAYLAARSPAPDSMVTELASRLAVIERAREAFPDSPSIAYSLGSMLQTTGDCQGAIAAYDAVLTLAPRHHDAALQRVICLGFERRHENAIAAATRALEGAAPAGDFLYWRAWNRRQLRQLDDARGDVEQALESRSDAETYTLAGVIKYEQGRYPAAERDLSTAVQMDPNQCLAQWHIGLVALARELWIATGEDFSVSADCYSRAVEAAERQLAGFRHADLADDANSARMASVRASLDDARSQQQASYLNAAHGFARGGLRERALAMLAAIPEDSSYAAGARELRRSLDETERDGH